MEQKETGAVVTDQNAEATPAVNASVDIEKVIAERLETVYKDKLETERRKWQSSIDQILTEKKTTEQKALTVEERMAHLEQERKAERLDWTRKDGKAQAGLDDDFHSAILDYASEDGERIKSGASKIKQLWASKEDAYKIKIKELEDRLQYGAKPPSSGTVKSDYNMESSMPKYL